MGDSEKIKWLEEKLSLFEQNGAAKMYYAINRKLNEIADMLNSNSLKNVNIDDPKDKSFDRIFKLLEKCETISNAAKTLGEVAGVTGDEDKDTKLGKYLRITTAESMADSIGDVAGQIAKADVQQD